MSTKHDGIANAGGNSRGIFYALPLSVVCAIVCLISAGLVFVLPFHVSVAFQPVISASLAAGFNNRVAAISAAIISVAVALWSWRRHAGPRLFTALFVETGVARTLVAWSIGVTISITACAGWALHFSGQRYLADAGYFIEQMSKYAEYGGTLYSQIEFAYGPLLFYPTVWLQKVLHVSTFAAYFVTLAGEQTVGLYELAYVLRVLPISGASRRFAFVLFAVGSINPLLGLNYTLFRYLTPVALLVFIANIRKLRTSATTLAVAQAISFGISAEMGVAFGAGALALIAWNAKRLGVNWLLVCAGPAVGALLFTATAGREYLRMLGAFAKGALNLPVSPYPHIVIFLFCVIWLVPFGVGHLFTTDGESARPILVCYAFALALLPSALGRCDPLHVFFNGLIFCLLSLIAIKNAKSYQRYCWCTCLVFFVVWQLGVINRLFRFRTADTLSAVLSERASERLANVVGPDTKLGNHLTSSDDDYQLDVAQLERAVGSSVVATPLEITPDVEKVLRTSHHFQSSYYAYMVDTFAAPAEQRAIDEMNRSEWALVPAVHATPFIELPGNLQDLQGFAFPVAQRRASAFSPGIAMEANLQNNWSVADTLGPYLLLKRRYGTSNVP